MAQLKGVAIGAGYFSKFQYEAWTRIPEVEITAFSNRNLERARKIIDEYGVPKHYTDYREMLEQERPDFVDVITPPDSHVEMCRFAGSLGIQVIKRRRAGTDCASSPGTFATKASPAACVSASRPRAAPSRARSARTARV